jgi:tetratricopeptide (TPR) repeat protein
MIGLEPVVTGLIANALYDEFTTRAKENKRKIVRRPQVVEDIGSAYLQPLKTNLERATEEEIDVDLEVVHQELDEEYDNVYEELVMTSNEEKIREALVDAILKTLPSDSEGHRVDRAAVENAVEYSLDTGFRAYVQSVEQAGLTEEVELELNLEILNRINNLSKGVEVAERDQQNTHFTIQKEPETITETDTTALVGAPESFTEFVNHSSLEDLDYDASRIVVGKKGAGKSRTLAHLIQVVCGRTTVDYLVNLEDSFRVDDIEALLSTGVNGTVVLVCDDVHRLEGPSNIHPFRRLVRRIKTEMGGDGHLIALCSVRSERINELPHIKRFNSDPVWSEFEKTRLKSLDSESVKEILQSTLDAIDRDIPQSVIEALAQAVIKIDPTPLYTVTIAQQLDSDSVDTEVEIEELLPQNIATAWEEDYQVLLEESPSTVRLLRTLKVFDRLYLPTNEGFVREVFRGAFDVCFVEYERALSKLVQRHWVEYRELEHSGGIKTRLVTHRAQIESIPPVPKSLIVNLTDYLYEGKSASFDVEDEELARVHIRIFKYCRLHQEIDHTELEKHAEKAIELASADLAVQTSVAVFYAELGRDDRALELVTAAAETKSDHPVYNYNCGNLLIKIREPDRAKQYLQRAVDEEPENPVFLHSLGSALVGSGEINEGLERLQQARDRGSFTFGEIYFSIGDAHNILGNYEQAVENIQKSIDIFEENQQWLNLSNAYNLLAIAHFNHSEYEDCVATSEKGYELTERILNGELPSDPILNDETLDAKQIQGNLVILQSEALVQM